MESLTLLMILLATAAFILLQFRKNPMLKFFGIITGALSVVTVLIDETIADNRILLLLTFFYFLMGLASFFFKDSREGRA